MNSDRYRRWGLIGLAVLAVAAIAYFLWRRNKKQQTIAPEDRYR